MVCPDSVPQIRFECCSFTSYIREIALPPSKSSAATKNAEDIATIRSTAKRPMVVFPELTTSNGRGLLNFESVFGKMDVPVKGHKLFIMGVRLVFTHTRVIEHIIIVCRSELPSPGSTTPTYPIATRSLLLHMFSLASSPTFNHPLLIRLLSVSDGPSSQTFLTSSYLPDNRSLDDKLTEVCANLIAGMARLKRTGLSWHDKRSFLAVYRTKQIIARKT